MTEPRRAVADESLCEAICLGQDVQSHWLELWNRHGARCLRIALRITRAEDEARAAVNEAWAKAHETMDPGLRSFAGWICILTRNQALDSLRSRTRRQSRESSLECTGLSALSTSPDPEARIAANEARRILLDDGSLGPEERKILTMRYVGGHRLEEIARITGKTANAVGVLLHRARQKLRLSPRVQELLLTLALCLATSLLRGGLA